MNFTKCCTNRLIKRFTVTKRSNFRNHWRGGKRKHAIEEKLLFSPPPAKIRRWSLDYNFEWKWAVQTLRTQLIITVPLCASRIDACDKGGRPIPWPQHRTGWRLSRWRTQCIVNKVVISISNSIWVKRCCNHYKGTFRRYSVCACKAYMRRIMRSPHLPKTGEQHLRCDRRVPFRRHASRAFIVDKVMMSYGQ